MSILVRLSFFLFTSFSFSLSPLGHCVLCKDVLSFVFQLLTFKFCVLAFVFCVLKNLKHKTPLHKTHCPNGDKLKENVVIEKRTIVQVYSHRHFHRFLCMSPSRRLTTQDTKHKAQNTKLESQKFETQNSKHPYTIHNVPMGTS